MADVMARSCFSQNLTSWKSPCPRASWDEKAYKGRCAYVHTLKDQAIPYEVQGMMLQGSGQEWIIRDMDTGHSAQLVAPDKLVGIFLELARDFEAI